MDDYEHLVQVDAVKNSGPPLNAFPRVKPCLRCPEGYIINLLLEELLHSKIFAGDDTEDPHKHIEFFDESCDTFKTFFLRMKLRSFYLVKPLVKKLMLGMKIVL